MATSPAPDAAAPPGMCPGIAVLGGGGDGGDGDGSGNGGKDGAGGDGHGNGEDGSGDGKNGGSGCGDPVCPITGRMFVELLDFGFSGPLPLRWLRHYSSRQAGLSGELGHGWSHAYGWRIRDGRHRRTELFDDQNRRQSFPKIPLGGQAVKNGIGWALRREGAGFVLVTQDGMRREFGPRLADGFHHLVAQRDANSNTIRIERDGAGALRGLVDSAGRPYVVDVDERRRIVRVAVAIDPTHKQWMDVVRYAYDDDDDLVGATDAEGYRAEYVYEQHLMVEHRTVSGLSYYYRYDGGTPESYCVESWGEYAGRIDPALESAPPVRPEGPDRRPVKGIFHRRFTYLKADRYSEVETSLGGVARYFGDEAGRVVKHVDPAGGVSERVFDPADGGLRAHSDERGAVFRVHPDAEGLPDGYVGPDGKGVRSLPGREDRSRYVLDERDGSVLERIYDERGNVVFVGYADGTVEEFAPDERGLPKWSRDRRGAVTSHHHDAMGNCIASQLPGGGVEVSQYDYLGRRLSHESRSGVRTEWTWDRRSDVIAKRHGDGSEIRLTRDANRQIIAIHERADVTRYEYGGQAWLTKIVAVDGSATVIKFDTEGNLTSMRNARGQVHRQWFDQAGRWIKSETFEGLTITAGHAASGDRIWRETPLGRESFEYDPAGNLVAATAADGQAFVIEYDLRGGPSVIDNGVARIEREYDVLGRVVAERSGKYATKIAYEGGDIQAVSSSVGLPLSYRRDATGRVRRLDAGATRLDLDNPVGQDLVSRLGDHLIRRQHFGPTGLLLRQSFSRLDLAVPEAEAAAAEDPNVLWWSSYEYRSGVLSREHHSDGRTVEYDLTSTEQISARRVVRGGVVEVEERLAYDPAGTPILPGARYDLAMRPVEIHGEALSYDQAGQLVGRLTDRGAWTYHWSGTGNLVRVQAPDHEVRMDYDGRGRRVRKQVLREGRLTRSIAYLWSEHSVLHEVDELRGATRTYLRRQESWDPYGHVDVVDGVETPCFYVLGPAQGIEAALDARGALVWAIEPTVYGHAEPRLAKVDVTQRFQNQHYDADVELVYNRHRWYDPRLGLYVSPDSFLLAGTLNPRDYALNPLRFADPTGHAPARPSGEPPPGTPGGAPDNDIRRNPNNPGSTAGMAYPYITNPGHWATTGEPGGPPGYIDCPPSHLTGTGPGNRQLPAWGSIQDQIDAAGSNYGCHSCGSRDPRGPDGQGDAKHFTPDHIPPRNTYDGTTPPPGAVRLYPQCRQCSNSQGGSTRGRSAADRQTNYDTGTVAHPNATMADAHAGIGGGFEAPTYPYH